MLLEPKPHVGLVYELSGPQAMDFHEIAAAFTDVYGAPYRFEDVSEDQARAALSDLQVPDDVLEDWLSMYRAVRQGVHCHLTDDVRHLTGREPTPVAEALSRLQD